MAKVLAPLRKSLTLWIDNSARWLTENFYASLILVCVFSFLPILNFISMVIASLITLRRGGKEGLIVVLAATVLPVNLVLMSGNYFILGDILFTALMIWGLSLLLRYTASWTLVIQVSVLISVALVALLHLAVPNLQSDWMLYLRELHTQISTSHVKAIQPLLEKLQVPLKPEELEMVFSLISKFMTGLTLAFAILSVLTNILLARWLQSRVYNPGGLGLELQEARSDWLSLIILAVLAQLAYLGSYIALDSLLVLLLPQCMLGLLIMHQFVAGKPMLKVMLLGIYAGLLFSQSVLPTLTVLLIVVVIDLLFDFRGRKNASHITRKNL